MITLPQNFEAILNRYDNQNLFNISVNSSIRKTILKANELLLNKNILSDFFFPEYTDHGITHINDVLQTTSDLVHPESLKELNNVDILILVSSVICHDIAMNLTAPILLWFFKNRNYDKDILPYVKKLNPRYNNYRHEYNEYFLEQSKRPELIEELFQPMNFDDFYGKVESSNLNNIDRKIIGEFIRRHHARMAFEIAAFGLPVQRNGKLHFEQILDFDGMPDNCFDLKLLSGVVAWSHNYNIKKSFDILKSNFGSLTYSNSLGSKAIYLMSLLRYADILQIAYERAGAYEFLDMKGISNPISLKEFEKHRSIFLVHPVYNKEGFLNVHVSAKRPIDIQFAKDTIESIRTEIRHSKEMISRYYGSHSILKFRYDQISSNIYSSYFSSHINCHNSLSKFKSSNNILPLLVEPLYSDKKKYGIRELLQNAIDACVQKQHYYKNLAENNETEYNGEVHIIQSGSTIVFSDDGIGMNIDEIDEYYLTIGNSIKNSTLTNTEGLIGKFGAGALAAFLLGKELICFTKRKDETCINYFKIDRREKKYLSEIQIFKASNIRNIRKEHFQSFRYSTFKTLKWLSKSESGTFFLINSHKKNSFSELKLTDFIWYFGKKIKVFLKRENNDMVNINNASSPTNFIDRNFSKVKGVDVKFTEEDKVLRIKNENGEVFYPSLVINDFVIDHDYLEMNHNLIRENDKEKKIDGWKNYFKDFFVKIDMKGQFVYQTDESNVKGGDFTRISFSRGVYIKDYKGLMPLNINRIDFDSKSLIEPYMDYLVNFPTRVNFVDKKINGDLMNLKELYFFDGESFKSISFCFFNDKKIPLSKKIFQDSMVMKYIQGKKSLFLDFALLQSEKINLPKNYLIFNSKDFIISKLNLINSSLKIDFPGKTGDDIFYKQIANNIQLDSFMEFTFTNVNTFTDLYFYFLNEENLQKIIETIVPQGILKEN